MPKKRKPALNLAKVIYDAYPDSDLLPCIDPEKDLVSLEALYNAVRRYGDKLGDSMFRFIVIEAWEGSEQTVGSRPIANVIDALDCGSEDLRDVLVALEEARDDNA
jgi:hypothetical protein